MYLVLEIRLAYTYTGMYFALKLPFTPACPDFGWHRRSVWMGLGVHDAKRVRKYAFRGSADFPESHTQNEQPRSFDRAQRKQNLQR